MYTVVSLLKDHSRQAFTTSVIGAIEAVSNQSPSNLQASLG